MDNGITKDAYTQRYKYIVEETVREVNRVLHHWYNSEKPVTYDDKLSLFRSYLAKYFKAKFGYSYYNYYIRWNNPLCTIDNNWNIIGITLTENTTREVQGFREFIKNFDFITFNIHNPVTPPTWLKRGDAFIKTNVEEVTIIEIPITELINYDKINNVKFTNK